MTPACASSTAVRMGSLQLCPEVQKSSSEEKNGPRSANAPRKCVINTRGTADFTPTEEDDGRMERGDKETAGGEDDVTRAENKRACEGVKARRREDAS